MTIRKFRSVDELPEAAPAADALAGLASACALSQISAAFGHSWRLPRGVQRFSSVEQADMARRAHEETAVRKAHGIQIQKTEESGYSSTRSEEP